MRAGAVSLIAALAVAALGGCTMGTEEPRRQGPPAMVAHGDGELLWLFVKQKELEFIGPRLRMLESERHTRTRHHFEIRAHDPRTTRPVWTKRLLTLGDNQGAHNAQARIIGQVGDKVWLFVHNQPVVVSSADASVIADRARLEEANPALKGLIPQSLKFYAFDNGLIITAADARRYRVSANDLRAAPHAVADEQAFQRLAHMTHTWNGGYETRDFLVRQGLLDGRWIGLHTASEAAYAGDDRLGMNLKDPRRVRDDGTTARRALWTARMGRTEGTAGRGEPRLVDVTRLPGALEFLQGAFLIRQGTQEPLRLQDPDGVLVVHRTRVDAEGRLALSRLDGEFREHWRAVLPIAEIMNRWQWPDRLLMIGTAQFMQEGILRTHDYIAAVDLRDGRVQAWNVTLEKAESATKGSDGKRWRKQSDGKT